MLATEYRPRKYADVVGQENVVSALRSISKNPDGAPRALILFGPYGSGKSTLARIFAKAINCYSHTGEACGQCEVCAEDNNFSPLYQELDATQVGNVEFIREYRQSLEYTSAPKDQYRVICLDEIQGASSAAQGALLKILEEVPPRTFFVFCTTHVDKILPTIRSRSVELGLDFIPAEKIKDRVNAVAEKAGIVIDQETVYRIALYSNGHLRDAMMKLNLYHLTEDKSTFADSVASSEKLILDFLVACKKKDRETCEHIIAAFARKPLAYLFRDWEVVVLNLLKGYSGVPTPRYKEVIDLYGAEVFKLLKILSADWVDKVFKEDVLYQAFLWFMFYELSKEQKSAAAQPSSQFRKV